MSLIYHRPFAADGAAPIGDELSADQPVMHALIIGVGRFPNLPPARNADRKTCADSARAIIEFLMEQASARNFQVPLASVECLVSDPGIDLGGQDLVSRCHPTRDPRVNENVDPGTMANVDAACDAWLTRCRPIDTGIGFKGDHLLLYICSHGVAGRDEGALAVMEDIKTEGFKRWTQLLNIGSMARHIPAATDAGAVWLFLDACQEVLNELTEMVDGVNAHEPARANISQMAKCKVTSLALAGSNFGDFAHAPAGGGIAYFTEALIDGLSNSCVENTPDGWVSTAKEIPGGVVKVAKSAYGKNVHTEILKAPSYDQQFLRVGAPRIPVDVTSSPSGILQSASKAAVIHSETRDELFIRDIADTEETWRLRVNPGGSLDIEITSPIRPAPYTARVMAIPPAQSVEVSDE